MIELVIKISEKAYNALTHTEFDANLVVDEMRKAIANGIPLPKGHGRLIDADKLLYEDIESIDGNTYMCVNAYDVEHAPTILEGSENE